MSRRGSVLKYGAGTPMVSSGIKVEDHDADFSLDSEEDNQSSSSSSSSASSALGGNTSVSFDAKTTQINEEETLKKQSMVLRIYHIDDPSHDVDHHNINLPQFISFKTLLVNGLSTGLDVIKVTLSKLLLPGDPASLAKHNFHLFIVQEDSKRKVEEHERLLPILEKFTKGGHECKIIFLRSSTADYVSAVGASLFSTTVFSNASTLSKIRVEYGAIEGEKIKHRTLLNDQQYSHFSNLTFITADGQRVFSHRAIIQSRCPSLVAGPYVKKCKEKKSSVVQGQKMLVVEYGDNTFMNRFVLMQVLDFVYSAQLDFEELSITETELIMYVAGQLTIPRLEWLCFRQLQVQINTQNVFLMLRQADQLKIESLKQFCTNYAHENWSDFSLNKSGLEIIGLDLFQDLTISKAQKAVSSSSGASPSGTTLVSPRGRSESIGVGGVPKDSIIDDFHSVYLGMAFADGKAVCKDSEEPVIFHKAILAAHSAPFFTMIDQYTKEKQPHLLIRNLERAEFQQLLQFVYTGTCDLTVRPALHLIEYGIFDFQMPELRDVCEKLICLKISLDVVLDLLYITYLPHCEGRPLLMKLRQTCLEYICDNFGLVDVARLRSLHPATMAYDLLDLMHQREAGSKQKNRKSISHTRKTFSFVD